MERNPIYYGSIEEMNKPISELIEELRNDLSRIRGKLFDIKMSYGYKDRIEHLEGGLTCMLVAMYSIKEEMQKLEQTKS